MTSPPILTQSDVERLLTDDSADSRANVLEKVVAHYNERQFSGRAQEIAEQIFRVLMKDVALRVREILATRLQDNSDIPRDIILHMASDVESVAKPVLESSPVLSDADLVEIVETSKNIEKLISITKRDRISTRVSEALVDTNYSQVVTSLLSNDGATVSDRTLERIIEDFRSDAHVTEAIVHYHKLPLTIVERLISTASVAVANELRQKYNINATQVKQETSSAREDFMLRLLEDDLPVSEIEALVAQMDEEERLTHSLAMTALCRGQLVFFTAALARFARISLQNAERLVADRGEHGFLGLYEKSGLPDSMFDAIRFLLRAVQDMADDPAIPGSMLYANRLVERVVHSAGDKPIEYLPYFIALIRRNVNKF